MNRRQFLEASGAAAISAFNIAKGATKDNQSSKHLLNSKDVDRPNNKKSPNIIWFHVDEQRPDSLGCYGSIWAKTPNLDRLAKQGAVFQECHVQSPVCVPSRTSQLFCRYPQDVGVYDNKYYYKDGIVNPEWMTFPQIFAANGYRTCSFGKWHTPNHPTWQENTLWQHFATVGMYALRNTSLEESHRIVKRPKGSSIILAGIYPHDHWGATSSSQITDMSLRWLEENSQSNQPFFLRVSHLWPHTPVLPPSPWHELYSAEEIPCNLDEYARAKQQRSGFDQMLANGQGGELLDEKTWRWIRQCYYGLCAQLDHQVGRVLHRLDELGLTQNTIIVYSSDHGKHLGEYGCCEKCSFDREVWRVPFIIAGPGVKPGQIRTDLCEAMDLGPTLLSLAGLKSVDSMCGRDLFSSDEPDSVFGVIEMGGKNEPTRPYAKDTQGLRRAGIRTKRWRCDFTISLKGGVETKSAKQVDASLFDVKNDPWEMLNLAKQEKHAKILNDLIQRTQEWYQKHIRC